MSRRGLFAVLAVVATASIGCCPIRKGVMLRGDWSLELNRVPWRTGCDSSCYESSGSAAGSDCVHGSGGMEEIPPPSPAGATHARFHAVPTRPVFGEAPSYEEPPPAARRPRNRQASSVLRADSRPAVHIEPTPADASEAPTASRAASQRTAKPPIAASPQTPRAQLARYDEPVEESLELRAPAPPIRSQPAPPRRPAAPTEPQWRARGSS